MYKNKATVLIFTCAVCLIFFINCKSRAQKMVFIPVKELLDIDTSMFKGKKFIYKQEVYFIDHYRDDSLSVKTIDSFVNKNKDPLLKTYGGYSITFYKLSSETNIKNIIANPKVIDRYSNQNDAIYLYKWLQGKFLIKFKYKDGEIIEPKNDVTIKDPPKPF